MGLDQPLSGDGDLGTSVGLRFECTKGGPLGRSPAAGMYFKIDAARWAVEPGTKLMVQHSRDGWPELP